MSRRASGTVQVALAVSHTQQLLHNMHYITQTITAIRFQTDQSEPSQHYDIIEKVVMLIRGSKKNMDSMNRTGACFGSFPELSAGYLVHENTDRKSSGQRVYFTAFHK